MPIIRYIQEIGQPNNIQETLHPNNIHKTLHPINRPSTQITSIRPSTQITYIRPFTKITDMRPYAQITAKLGGDIPGKAGLLQKAYNPAWQSQRSEQKKQALASYIEDIRFSFICLF